MDKQNKVETVERREKARKLFSQGIKRSQIARELKLSFTTITRYLQGFFPGCCFCNKKAVAFFKKMWLCRDHLTERSYD